MSVNNPYRSTDEPFAAGLSGLCAPSGPSHATRKTDKGHYVCCNCISCPAWMFSIRNMLILLLVSMAALSYVFHIHQTAHTPASLALDGSKRVDPPRLRGEHMYAARLQQPGVRDSPTEIPQRERQETAPITQDHPREQRNEGTTSIGGAEGQGEEREEDANLKRLDEVAALTAKAHTATPSTATPSTAAPSMVTQRPLPSLLRTTKARKFWNATYSDSLLRNESTWQAVPLQRHNLSTPLTAQVKETERLSAHRTNESKIEGRIYLPANLTAPLPMHMVENSTHREAAPETAALPPALPGNHTGEAAKPLAPSWEEMLQAPSRGNESVPVVDVPLDHNHPPRTQPETPSVHTTTAPSQVPLLEARHLPIPDPDPQTGQTGQTAIPAPPAASHEDGIELPSPQIPPPDPENIFQLRPASVQPPTAVSVSLQNTVVLPAQPLSPRENRTMPGVALESPSTHGSPGSVLPSPPLDSSPSVRMAFDLPKPVALPTHGLGASPRPPLSTGDVWTPDKVVFDFCAHSPPEGKTLLDTSTVPVDQFVPATGAVSKEQARAWQSAVLNMKARLQRVKVGGTQLRDLLHEEVSKLRDQRKEIFCR